MKIMQTVLAVAVLGVATILVLQGRPESRSGLPLQTAAAQVLPPPDLRIPIEGEPLPPVSPPTGAAQDDQPPDPRTPWSAFALDVMLLPGMVLHYERDMGPQMEAVQRAIGSHLAFETEERLRAERVILRAGDITRELQQLIGLQAEDEEMQAYTEVLAETIRSTPRLINVDPVHVYLVRQSTIKEALRAGRELPGFEYDAQRDEAAYNFGVIVGGTETAPVGVLPLPVVPDEPIDRQVEGYLEALRVPQRTVFAAAMHEVATMMILARLEPRDPYYRWFTEGFATALALRLTEKHVSPETAAAFRPTSADFADVQNELNLYYWLAAGNEVATPLESEAKLAAARYAYAVDEANFMIDRSGVGVLRAILDRVAQAEDPNVLRKLEPAIFNATGINVAEHFKKYQQFATKEEGIKLYAQRSNEALSREDYAAMLPNVLRIMELREQYDVNGYANVAYILFRMGYDELGDEVFNKQLALLEATVQDGLLREMRVKHMEYALRTEAPWIAYDSAESLLETEPDFVPALALRVQRLVEEEDYDQAGLTAQRIIELDKTPNSPYVQAARQLLDQLEPVTP